MAVSLAVPSRSKSQLLAEYGGFPLAGQLIQPNLHYFNKPDGFLAFQKVGKDIIVIGDPICSDSYKQMLLTSFLQLYPNAVFVQVHQQTACLLASKGYFVNSFGIERSLALPYALNGKLKKDVRLLYNAGKRNGIVVRELTRHEITNGVDKDIKAGIHRRNRLFQLKKEFKFLARTSCQNLPEDTRIFGGFVDSELVGYSIFDPIYEHGQLQGYAEVVPKRSKNAPKGTRVIILFEAMHQFNSESIKEVNLGLSPLENINLYDTMSGLPFSRLGQYLLNLVYRHANFLFNFQGLAFHKSRFRGKIQPVYLASKSELPVKILYQIFHLTTGYKIPPIW